MSKLMYLFTKQIVTNSITIYVEILTEVQSYGLLFTVSWLLNISQ